MILKLWEVLHLRESIYLIMKKKIYLHRERVFPYVLYICKKLNVTSSLQTVFYSESYFKN